MSDLIISTLTQGLIYALLSYGVYITYSVLDFPDLTVDSCFPLGAAVTAILLLKGVDPWATLLCSAAAGAIAGLCTGLIHVRLGVRDLLAGIITMTALSSINLLIAGSNVTVERAVDTIFTSKGVMALFGNLTLGWRKLIISLVLAIVVKLLLDLYFRTKSGLLLRAVGDNGTLVTTLAQNKGNMKILGVVISNALVALCGSVLCQEQRSYSAVMGIGQVVFGLATVIIGISLIRFFTSSKAAQGLRKVKGLRFLATPQGTTAVLLGSILLQGHAPHFPRGKVAAECCALGLWQTTAQYAFYYIAVAMLTGAFGGILNSTQSFLGVIFAHFIYGNADRMTPAKTLGCAIGFAGVLIGTIGNHGSGSGWGVFCMMAATVIFTLSGPWNKSVTKKADSFAVCFLNLFVGGLALFVLGTVMGGRLHVQSALAVLVMLYLAFICGAGYILWALLMKNNPVSRIAIFGFVNPVVNVLLSAVLNGEPLFRWQYLAALVFVCVGIWLVNKAPAQKEKV